MTRTRCVLSPDSSNGYGRGLNNWAGTNKSGRGHLVHVCCADEMQVDQRVSTEVSGEVSMSDAAEKKTGYSGDQPSVSPAPINGDVEEGSNNDLSASELTLTSQTVLSDLTLEGGQEVEESANWEGGGNNQNGDVGEGEEVQEEVEEGVEWQDILGNGQLMKKVRTIILFFLLY